MLFKNVWAALLLGAIVYIVFRVITPTPAVEQVQPPTHAVNSQTPAKTARTSTFGSVEIAPNYFLPLLSDSIFICGLKGYGKSVLLYNILLEIHKRFTQDQVQLVLIDMKKTGYIPFSRSPFVLNNTVYSDVDGIKLVEQLLAQRQSEYYKLSSNKVIDNLATYHREKSDSQPNFPHILLVIDEVHLLDDTGNNTPNLFRVDNINKIGRSFGITVIMATVRGTAYIPAKMLTQFDVRCVGYLNNKSGREYKYAGLDDETIAKMRKQPGLFAVSTNGEDWDIVHTNNVQMEAITQLAETFPQPNTQLGSSAMQNNVIALEWFRTLDKKPLIEEVMDKFACEKVQAAKFLTLWSRK